MTVSRSARVPVSLAGLCLALLLTPVVRGQVPPPPAGITAEAPVVAGNAASAKQRAVAEAFRQAVDARFRALLVETGISEPLPPALQRLRDSLPSRAPRFIRSHRLLSEQEVGGMFRVVLEAEVDDTALGREIERTRGPVNPTKAAAGKVLILGGGPSEALAHALGAAGIPSELIPGLVDEAGARELMGKRGASAATLVAATANVDGPVRGTDNIAVSCRVSGRLVRPAGVDRERAAEERAFGETEALGRDACFARASTTLGRELAGALLGEGPAASRALLLELDLLEPAALSPVLQGLRRVASVSSSEVRQVTVGRVSIRVLTRLGAEALGQALTRELGPAVNLEVVESVADRLVLRVRLASSAAAPAPVATP